MICPECQGEKRIAILPKIVKGIRITDVGCHRCDGTGVVDDRALFWVLLGESLRNLMIQNRITLREGAAMLGVSAMDLSNARIGKVDPTETYNRMRDAINARRTA